MIVAMYLNFIRFLEKAHLAFNFILDRTQMSAEHVVRNKTKLLWVTSINLYDYSATLFTLKLSIHHGWVIILLPEL